MFSVHEELGGVGQGLGIGGWGGECELVVCDILVW